MAQGFYGGYLGNAGALPQGITFSTPNLAFNKRLIAQMSPKMNAVGNVGNMAGMGSMMNMNTRF